MNSSVIVYQLAPNAPVNSSNALVIFAPISTRIDTANDDVFQQDIRLSFSNDVYHCVISLFYSDITIRETQSDVVNVGLVDPTLPPTLTSDFNFDIESQNIAIYGELEIEAWRALP